MLIVEGQKQDKMHPKHVCNIGVEVVFLNHTFIVIPILVHQAFNEACFVEAGIAIATQLKDLY